jgi:hypothetical protein
MNRQPWADWELQLLREEYGDSLTSDIAKTLRRSLGSVYQRAGVLGLKKAAGFAAEASRRATLARSPFTPEISEIIELLYPDTVTQTIADLIGMPVDRVLAYANHKGWAKTPEFVREAARQRMTPDHPAAKHWFAKGIVPRNKGVKGYQSGGRSSETWFKKGTRNGQAAKHWMPIGSLRVNADGYLDRKVADTGYPPDDWKSVHRQVWVAAKGPVPAGHVVRFREGCRTTKLEEITLDKLECITLAENMRRNSFHTQCPPEVAKLIISRGHLQRMINKRARATTEEKR